MCGKFTQMNSWQAAEAFTRPLGVANGTDEIVISTPMRLAKIMRLNALGERELVEMRWGFAGKDDLVPSRPKHMHARGETVDRLPTFAPAFASSRGILMVHTFNEGEELASGKTKQWVIAPQDGLPVAIAVICEVWRNGAETLQTFVQVTTPANTLISRITDRMPAVLPRETWATWLGEMDASPAEVKDLLRTYEDGGNWMMMEQVSNRSPRTRRPNPQQDLFWS
jgi:putative SOS response-associated peptidase YedK